MDVILKTLVFSMFILGNVFPGNSQMKCEVEEFLETRQFYSSDAAQSWHCYDYENLIGYESPYQLDLNDLGKDWFSGPQMVQKFGSLLDVESNQFLEEYEGYFARYGGKFDDLTNNCVYNEGIVMFEGDELCDYFKLNISLLLDYETSNDLNFTSLRDRYCFIIRDRNMSGNDPDYYSYYSACRRSSGPYPADFWIHKPLSGNSYDYFEDEIPSDVLFAIFVRERTNDFDDLVVFQRGIPQGDPYIFGANEAIEPYVEIFPLRTIQGNDKRVVSNFLLRKSYNLYNFRGIRPKLKHYQAAIDRCHHHTTAYLSLDPQPVYISKGNEVVDECNGFMSIQADLNEICKDDLANPNGMLDFEEGRCEFTIHTPNVELVDIVDPFENGEKVITLFSDGVNTPVEASIKYSTGYGTFYMQNYELSLIDCPENYSTFACAPWKVKKNVKYLISGWVFNELNGTSSGKGGFVLQNKISGNFNNLKFISTKVNEWEKIEGVIEVSSDMEDFDLVFVNLGNSNTYFDDIRFVPVNSEVKTMVYNFESNRLEAELDENNYPVFYNYDDEGRLVKMKRKTQKGTFTTSEKRVESKKKF